MRNENLGVALVILSSTQQILLFSFSSDFVSHRLTDILKHVSQRHSTQVIKIAVLRKIPGQLIDDFPFLCYCPEHVRFNDFAHDVAAILLSRHLQTGPDHRSDASFGENTLGQLDVVRLHDFVAQ